MSLIRIVLLQLIVTFYVAGPSHAGIRIATFNTSMNRSTEGRLFTELQSGTSSQIRRVAEVIQIVRPDILLINEFDHDAEQSGMQLFHDNYLAVGQRDHEPIQYPHRFTAPSNTGVPSGFDLNNNGRAVTQPGSGYADDCFGFGSFPGQYGMVILSKFPIRTEDIRTFQKFLWKDMPDALLPDKSSTEEPGDWFSSEELSVMRLSSKSHWDVPIDVNGKIIHILACHPTPPVFDGAEDRNGRRNHDEIRFWADYILPSTSGYIYDDEGTRGGLGEGARFAILGDMNADPLDGDSTDGAINQLLKNPAVDYSKIPSSEGGKAAAETQGGVNRRHEGPPEYDTGDFNDSGTGNLRIDYVLPSKAGLEIKEATVFWPQAGDPNARLLSTSDHRMVYVDLEFTGAVSNTKVEVDRLQIRRTAGDSELSWNTENGVAYAVQFSDDLASNAWQAFPEETVVIDPESRTASARDQTNQAMRFYRIAVERD